jgi:ATP synthase protein I
MMGMVGWSVVVPTLLGAAVGLWVDKHYASSQSWTLALLIGGLSVGCINAWYWIDKEAKTMREEQNNDTEL